MAIYTANDSIQIEKNILEACNSKVNNEENNIKQSKEDRTNIIPGQLTPNWRFRRVFSCFTSVIRLRRVFWKTLMVKKTILIIPKIPLTIFLKTKFRLMFHLPSKVFYFGVIKLNNQKQGRKKDKVACVATSNVWKIEKNWKRRNPKRDII